MAEMYNFLLWLWTLYYLSWKRQGHKQWKHCLVYYLFMKLRPNLKKKDKIIGLVIYNEK